MILPSRLYANAVSWLRQPEGGNVAVVYPQWLTPHGTEVYLGGFADVMEALRERRWVDAETALQLFERQLNRVLSSILARARYA